MINRRILLSTGAALLGGAWLRRARAEPPGEEEHPHGHGDAPASRPHVVTPNGTSLPWRMRGGVKEFHLVAEEVVREFAPGLTVRCWGYNGTTPGPTIEAVEGDRIRVLVTNRLPEHTNIHWHGVLLPNGMDGVGGLTQPQIGPGETYAYEFTLRQHGTQMYHPHADETLQIGVGMMGLFVIHPREPQEPAVDRDFAIMLHEWAVHPGTYRPDPAVMLDFNLFTFNSKVFPATEPLVVRTGQRVRIRLANLSMDEHPIHVHGFHFRVTGTDGGPVPPSARWPEATVLVPVGATRDIEFVADAPGDWALHCHKTHHVMNGMAHDLPNALGANLKGVEERIRRLLPGFMTMGERGMSGMQEMAKHMPGPENTLPMLAGEGPFGPIEMGGMMTILKVRDGITSFEDPGWYDHPPGTVARSVKSDDAARSPEEHGGHEGHGG